MFALVSTLGVDTPRSVTHPDVSTVPWHDHSDSFRIGSGCTSKDCTGGGASANIPHGALYKCWGPLKVPVGSGKLHRFLPEVDMKLVHHMILYAGHCGSRLIYAWARTGQASRSHPCLRPLCALSTPCLRPVCVPSAPCVYLCTLPAPTCAQTAPIGLDFDSWDRAAGYGYPVGAASPATGAPMLTHVSRPAAPTRTHTLTPSANPNFTHASLRI